MKSIAKIRKIILFFVVICLFFAFYIINIAYARGGRFGQRTLILTPEGEKPIKQLHPGDQIMSHNFTSHHLEEGNISKIQVTSSAGYFLVNGKIKVIRTHPFYVQTFQESHLVEAQYLKKGDQLIGEEGLAVVISSLDILVNRSRFIT